MKRYIAGGFLTVFLTLTFMPSSMAYDFREEQLQRDMSDVTPYIEELLHAEQGDTAVQAVSEMPEIDYSKAVHVPFIEVAAWQDFLQQAADGIWTDMPVARENWIVPVAINDEEKEIAMLMEPFEQAKDGHGYSTITTRAQMYDFVFTPEEVAAILHEGGLDACDDLRIYGILNEGSIFITAQQDGQIYIIPYTGAPASVWGSADKTVVPAAEFYAGAAEYMEDLLTPKDWIGTGGGGATEAGQSQKTWFILTFCLILSGGAVWLWKRGKNV